MLKYRYSDPADSQTKLSFFHLLSFSFLYTTTTLLHAENFFISLTQHQHRRQFKTMDSLPSVSSSMVLHPTNPFHPQTRRLHLFYPRLPPSPRLLSSTTRRNASNSNHVSCNSAGAGDHDDGIDDVERALHMDGTIPGTSDEFVKRVSSRAYDMRRHLQQSFDSTSYDGTESSVYSFLSFQLLLNGFSILELGDRNQKILLMTSIINIYEISFINLFMTR